MCSDTPRTTIYILNKWREKNLLASTRDSNPGPLGYRPTLYRLSYNLYMLSHLLKQKTKLWVISRSKKMLFSVPVSVLMKRENRCLHWVRIRDSLCRELCKSVECWSVTQRFRVRIPVEASKLFSLHLFKIYDVSIILSNMLFNIN